MNKEQFEQAKQTILSNSQYYFLKSDGRYVFHHTQEGQTLALCLETFFGVGRDKLAFSLPDGTIVDTENNPIIDTPIISKPLKEEDLVVGKLYKHVKTGGIYRLVGVSLETETGEQSVVYQSELGNQMYSRPKEMWMDGRFQPHYPKEYAEFMFVKVYRGDNFIVEGTYPEICDWVRRNILKNDKPTHFAHCEWVLEEHGFRIVRTKHVLGKSYWE